jgi:hypothetical protein
MCENKAAQQNTYKKSRLNAGMDWKAAVVTFLVVLLLLSAKQKHLPTDRKTLRQRAFTLKSIFFTICRQYLIGTLLNWTHTLWHIPDQKHLHLEGFIDYVNLSSAYFIISHVEFWIAEFTSADKNIYFFFNSLQKYTSIRVHKCFCAQLFLWKSVTWKTWYEVPWFFSNPNFSLACSQFDLQTYSIGSSSRRQICKHNSGCSILGHSASLPFTPRQSTEWEISEREVSLSDSKHAQF